MLIQIRQSLEFFLRDALKPHFPDQTEIPLIEVEQPADKSHGDLATNIAMKSAKLLRKPPVVIAEEFIKTINAAMSGSPLGEKIARVQVKGQGFINFTLTGRAYGEILGEVFRGDCDFGRMDLGQGARVLLEFVSANPTGPLSVAHARQAAIGDALTNILNFCGCRVQKEYYINDGGNQIVMLGQSLLIRAREIFGDTNAVAEFVEGHYLGGYMKDIAAAFIQEKGCKNLEDLNRQPAKEASRFAADYLLGVNRRELQDFGVVYDQWTRESEVAGKGKIVPMLEELAQKGLTEEKDGALWFKTTVFGDDKDRVLRKSDGTYTYLTPDIVYHKNKFSRGFDKVYNILGPDHHGYIKRLKAAAQALGKNADDLEVLIVQLATIYRNGQAVSMSTRKGEFISLQEVMDEVGVDAARFFFLMRQMKQHLEFDLELAKKETPENPVFYVQYAHARVYSINKKANEAGVHICTENFDRLSETEEIDLIKALGSFPVALSYCYEQIDPYPLVTYLQDTAGLFHRFYDKHKVICDDAPLSAQRLGLVNAARIVLANGLRLIGVCAPEQM